MPIRTGIDLAEIARVRDLLDRYGEHFRRRFFREPELNYASRGDEAEQLAGLWAAKEAVFKVLGFGYRWQSVIIHHQPSGRPRVKFRDGVRFHRTPIPEHADWDVSITHDAGLAVASATCVWFEKGGSP